MSDAMAYCSSGSPESIVINEEGTVLMKHHEVPIEDIFGLMVAHTFLEVQDSIGFLE